MNIDNFVTRVYELQALESNPRIILPNPYDIAANDDISLRNGFAVALGDAERDDTGGSYRDRSVTMNRSVTLTYTSKNIGNRQDPSLIRSIESELRNEAYSFFGTITKDRSVNSVVLSINISSDSKEFLGGEDDLEHISFSLTLNVINKESF